MADEELVLYQWKDGGEDGPADKIEKPQGTEEDEK